MLNFNRNSVEESDQELMKHVCKLCNKGFPCGRSLGGHMRSHVINSTDPHHHHHQRKKKMKMKMKLSSVNNNGGNLMNTNKDDLGYELRKEPKKTLKAVINGSLNPDDFVVLDKLCKECGKGFQSWKALFGHMKCHSDKLSKDSWISRTKKSKSRSRTSSDSMNANHASISVVSDIDDDDDQEAEIAMCLIMLSRDVGQWGEKMIENDCKMNKSDDQIKRNFECATCNKSFHSYQALGGHKASHKKLKACFESKPDDKNMIKTEPMLDHDHMINECCEKTFDNHQPSSSFNLGESLKNTMVVGGHECSICLRMFASGQALGGHKRSHLIAEAKLNQENANSVKKFDKPVHEIRGSLDLNMPPDDDHVEGEQEMGYNPWCYNHESTLLGLLSTS